MQFKEPITHPRSVEEYKQFHAIYKACERQRATEQHNKDCQRQSMIKQHKRFFSSYKACERQSAIERHKKFKRIKSFEPRHEQKPNMKNEVAQAIVKEEPETFEERINSHIMCSTSNDSDLPTSHENILPTFEIVPDAGGDIQAMVEDIVKVLYDNNHKFHVNAKVGPVNIRISNT